MHDGAFPIDWCPLFVYYIQRWNRWIYTYHYASGVGSLLATACFASVWLMWSLGVSWLVVYLFIRSSDSSLDLYLSLCVRCQLVIYLLVCTYHYVSGVRYLLYPAISSLDIYLSLCVRCWFVIYLLIYLFAYLFMLYVNAVSKLFFKMHLLLQI